MDLDLIIVVLRTRNLVELDVFVCLGWSFVLLLFAICYLWYYVFALVMPSPIGYYCVLLTRSFLEKAIRVC